ncbi:porin [Novipirellula artificiosorum]|nr:porin [Novipirellula artificiosorum]
MTRIACVGVIAAMVFTLLTANAAAACNVCRELGSTPDVGCSGCDTTGPCDAIEMPCDGLCCQASGCAAAEPWSMPQPCFLQQSGFKVGGWLQQGFTSNASNPEDGFNGPLGTNDWDDRYQLNQFWLWLHRPADNGGNGWAWGGHLDMTYGTDFRFGVNHGLEDRINGANQDYGLVIPQGYLEVAYNDLSVKFGHMAAILDYESVPAVANPFYSHSYSYAYTVPQLVTGFLADYQLTDQLSVQAGLHRGWFMFEDLNDSWDFMGGIKWESLDKKSSIAWACNFGPQDPGMTPDWNGIPGDQDRFVYSLVYQRQLTKKLRYVGVHNLGIEQNTPVNLGDHAEWYGLNQYLLYTINPRWSSNLRFEVIRDDDGMKIAGPGNYPALAINANDGFGYVGDFYELTYGLTYIPHPNLRIRPEVRWDYFDLGGPLGPKGLPFDSGDKDDQFTFAVDAVLTF